MPNPLYKNFFALILQENPADTDKFGEPIAPRLLKGRCKISVAHIEMTDSTGNEVVARNKFQISPEHQHYFRNGGVNYQKQGRMEQISEHEYNNDAWRPENDTITGSGRILEVKINEALTSKRAAVRILTT